MKTIDITTPQNVTIRYELASLVFRIVAFIIDIFILMSCYFIFFLFTALFFSTTAFFEYVLLGFLLLLVFHTLVLEILLDGQTLGKKAMKIRVVHLTGRPPNITDYLIRWCFRVIDIWFSSGAIASVLCNTTSTGQRLGGMLSNTTVIKEVPTTVYTLKDLNKIQSSDEYEPKYLGVAQFENDDVLLIKRVIDRYTKYKNEAHSQALVQLTEKVAESLQIPTPKKNKIGFLKTVIKDYIVLTR